MAVEYGRNLCTHHHHHVSLRSTAPLPAVRCSIDYPRRWTWRPPWPTSAPSAWQSPGLGVRMSSAALPCLLWSTSRSVCRVEEAYAARADPGDGRWRRDKRQPTPEGLRNPAPGIRCLHCVTSQHHNDMPRRFIHQERGGGTAKRDRAQGAPAARVEHDDTARADGVGHTIGCPYADEDAAGPRIQGDGRRRAGDRLGMQDTSAAGVDHPGARATSWDAASGEHASAPPVDRELRDIGDAGHGRMHHLPGARVEEDDRICTAGSGIVVRQQQTSSHCGHHTLINPHGDAAPYLPRAAVEEQVVRRAGDHGTDGRDGDLCRRIVLAYRNAAHKGSTAGVEDGHGVCSAAIVGDEGEHTPRLGIYRHDITYVTHRMQESARARVERRHGVVEGRCNEDAASPDIDG